MTFCSKWMRWAPTQLPLMCVDLWKFKAWSFSFLVFFAVVFVIVVVVVSNDCVSKRCHTNDGRLHFTIHLSLLFFFDLNGLEMSFKKWQILSLLKNLSCFTNDDLWNHTLTLFIALYFYRRDRHKVDNGHNKTHKYLSFSMLKQKRRRRRHRFLMVSKEFLSHEDFHFLWFLF